MNRRGFFVALSGLVAWSKKPVSVSPVASAIPRALPGRIDWIDLSVYKPVKPTCLPLIGTKVMGELEWGGQTDFPIVASDGGLASSAGR